MMYASDANGACKVMQKASDANALSVCILSFASYALSKACCSLMISHLDTRFFCGWEKQSGLRPRQYASGSLQYGSSGKVRGRAR